jgi:GNAT superfamily N-acetyltransferase
MNIQTTFEKADPVELASLRRAHRAALIEAQELLLEGMSARAAHYRIVHRGETCGYFAILDLHTLVEFYLAQPYWLFGERIVSQVVRRTGVRRALVQSFDHLFLSSAVAQQTRVRSLGYLVRDYLPRPLPPAPDSGLELRTATPADLPRIARVDQPVFTDPTRLESVVAGGHLVLFERGDALLGFGIAQPVVEGRPEVDVGIAMDAAHRNTGDAVYLFRQLIERCVAAGLRPVAGCAADNQASRNLGDRVGLVSRYRLLELSFESEA